MSRVENESRSESSQSAERAAKEADKKARDAKQTDESRQAFGKMLSGQKAAKETTAQQAKSQAESKQTEQKGQASAKQAEHGARSAQLARGGVLQHAKVMEQAKGFQGALENTQQKTSSNDQARVTTRDSGKQKDKVESDDRQGELIQKSERRKDADVEKARVEAREGQRPNAAIGSDAGKDSGGGGAKDDGSAAAAAAAKKQPQAAAAEKVAAKHEVKQIPPEMLEKLVSTVYLAVTEKGLKEFQIELKDGVLKGAFLKISAENGKVGLSFSGLDANTKNLVESSKGDLMRRLEKKGLKLARLDVG